MELATRPGRLAGVRERLAHNLPKAPLFDTAQFTRHLQAAFEQIYGRAQAGLPPDHIELGA